MRFATPAARDRSHTALKAVVAAGAAWELGRLVGHEDVAYFAPITALVAIHPVVARSLRESLHYGASVVAGVLLAAAVGALVGANLAGIVLVVGLGAALGALPPFGRTGANIAFWALLVLLVGGTDPAAYLRERLPEAALGLAVGAAVNLALVPRTRLRPADEALARLRAGVAAALADMAADLRDGGPGDPPAWAGADERLGHLQEEARAAMRGAEDSVRWNPRGRVRGRGPRLGRSRADLGRFEHVADAARAIARTLEEADLDDGFRGEYADLLAAHAAVLEGSDPGATLESTRRTLRELEEHVGRRREDRARSWLSEALLLVELDHVHAEMRA